MMYTQEEIGKLKSAIEQIYCIGQDINLDDIVKKLHWCSALQETDSKKFTAGLIFVYYQFIESPEPAIAAAQWRLTGDITNAQGKSGQEAFDLGFKLIDG